MPRLKIVIVGAGSRAAAHQSTLHRLTDLYTLVGVADAASERRDAAARDWHVPAFATADELFTATKPDVAFVIVPPDGHYPVTAAAAQRGIHVITEVPIATTLPLADAMAEVCERHQVVLEVAENVFRWPREQLRHQIVAEGLIGSVTQVHLTYRSGSYHGFSAVRRLVPSTPRRILGVADLVEGPARPDLMGNLDRHHPWELGVIEFANGATAIYEQPIDGDTGNRWDVVGTDGRLTPDELVLEDAGDVRRFPIERKLDTVDGVRELAEVSVATDTPVVWKNPYRGRGFVNDDDVARADILIGVHRSVVDGGPVAYGAQGGRADQEILIALRESARTGSTWVNLPLRAMTGVERRLHDEHRARYGHDPIEGAMELASTSYPRLGVRQTVSR